MNERPSEIRLSLRAAVALFVVPQVCTLAALSVLFLGGQDRAAPLREHRQAQAETIPLAPPERASVEPSREVPLPALPGGQTISMPRLLERLLASAESPPLPARRAEAAVLPKESREAIGTRLRAEIEEGFSALEGVALPEGLGGGETGQLDEVRTVIADLQALQASFAGLRSGGGAGGALGGAAGTLSQVVPLLDALQNLREGRLGQDPGLLENLDSYLGRDEERPRRLGLLLLLAWALDDSSAV